MYLLHKLTLKGAQKFHCCNLRRFLTLSFQPKTFSSRSKNDARLIISDRLLPINRKYHPSVTKSRFKIPLRVLRLCVLGVLLPCVLCILILHMRYRVYVEQMYPLAVSDMRMLDNRISTTWCQVSEAAMIHQLIDTNLMSAIPWKLS